MIREEIDWRLEPGRGRETNLLFELAELGVRYLAQQGLEQEQQDFLGRGHYERRSQGEGRRGYRNGYEDAELKTAEGAMSVRVPQVRTQSAPIARGSWSFWTATPKSWSASSSRCTRACCRRATSRTLKEQCLWARLREDVEDLRQAVLAFTRRYNHEWLIRTPRSLHAT
jgi:hypothetical protein